MIGLDAAARPSCVIGASVWISVLVNRPVQNGWYLLAAVEIENRTRNKPNIIND